MRLRPLLVAALAAALALTLAGCGAFPRGMQEFAKRAVAAKPNSAPPSHPLVTAFEPSWDDGAVLKASKNSVSMVAISGIDIAEGGASVTEPTAAVLRQVKLAHQLGKKAEVLLLNYQAGVGFSDEVAKSIGIMPGTTICGLADGAGWPIKNAVQKFRPELEQYIQKGQRSTAASLQLVSAH